MFPEELWETIGAAAGPRYRPKTGRLDSKIDIKSRMDKIGDHIEEGHRKDQKASMIKADNEDDGMKDEEDDDQNSVEYDDTFEDGEDDMAGDYNAEQYFNGGDEDNDDGYDGGGGGGGEDW